jgi:hypothetical protein
VPAMLPVLTQTPPSVWGNRECKLAACPLEASAEPGPTIPSQQAMAYLLRMAARPGGPSKLAILNYIRSALTVRSHA